MAILSETRLIYERTGFLAGLDVGFNFHLALPSYEFSARAVASNFGRDSILNYFFGNENSALGSFCFSALTCPFSTTNSNTTSENCGVRNRSPFTWFSGIGGPPGPAIDRPVFSW